MSKPNSILALRVPPVNRDAVTAVYIRGVPHSDSALRSSRMHRVADKEEELKRLQCPRSSMGRKGILTLPPIQTISTSLHSSATFTSSMPFS